MQIKNSDKQIFQKLQNLGWHLSNNIQQSMDNKAVILSCEFILGKIIRDINELVSLWRNLFPETQLQKVKLTEEKKKIPSRQWHSENDTNKAILTQQEMAKRTGIEHQVSLMPGRKTDKAKPQFIYDLFKDRKVIYHVSGNKGSNYQLHHKQYSMAGYSENYQIPKQIKFFSNSKLKPPYQHKYSGVFGQSSNNYRSYSRTPKLYTSQISSKSDESGAGSYKSIESYLTDYKEMIKNEI